MKTGCFNLVDEPWLPVTLASSFPDSVSRGPAPRVSLREAFEFGDRIVDLRCYAHERIALMRLLICIAHRALKGPETEEDWKTRQSLLADEAVKYLEKEKDCFNLFGDGPRFLQAHPQGNPGTLPVVRLQLVDKDTPTLFDGHITPRTTLSDPELAVSLVTYQSFSAGGKVGGSETVTENGKAKTQPQGGEAGLCRDGSAIHAFVRKSCLTETVHANLVCRSSACGPMTWSEHSKPIWEYKNTQLSRFRTEESRIARDYLERLVPLARAIWLNNDRTTIEVGNGLQYGVFADSKGKGGKIKAGTSIRELTASAKLGQGKEPVNQLVSATAGGGVPKSAWRELHSIGILRSAGGRGGPVALEHLAGSSSDEAVLWCGALVSNQAKVGDIVESSFRLPTRFLDRDSTADQEDALRCPGANMTYRKGVAFAEHWAGRLRWAVATYHEALKDDERGKTAKEHAALSYWTALEPRAEPILLWDVAVHSDKYWSAEGDWMARSPWGQEVRRAARDAYKLACPHTTPRQIRAFAAGLDVLLRPPKKTDEPKVAEEEREEGDDT